jgi:hypothetical protein
MAKEEEEEKSQYVIARYKNRLSVLKKAQEYSSQGKIADAVKYYNEYLNALASYLEVKEEKLKPTLFNQEKELAEMLLVSQVYWDLAKAYDRSPKLAKECERCLKQFTLFTIGFKYQYLNSEMIRKFIKKKISYHPEYFERAYQEIKVQSKKCYVATYCYGETHEITFYLRNWKKEIQNNRYGDLFVDLYYRFSPRLVNMCEKYSFIRKLSLLVLRPVVYISYKVIRALNG